MSQAEILEYLAKRENEEVKVKDIAKKLEISEKAVLSALNKLFMQGLIRKRLFKDGRVHYLLWSY